MEVEIKVNPLFVKFLILKMLVGSLLAIGPAPEFAYLGMNSKDFSNSFTYKLRLVQNTRCA